MTERRAYKTACRELECGRVSGADRGREGKRNRKQQIPCWSKSNKQTTEDLSPQYAYEEWGMVVAEVMLSRSYTW